MKIVVTHNPTAIDQVDEQGRKSMSRGEVGIPTYYWQLKRGDKRDLLALGFRPCHVRRASGLCILHGRLALNVSHGVYYVTYTW